MRTKQHVPYIICSLLDLDFYKLAMLQFIWFFYRSVQTTFAFKNRTKGIALGEYVSLQELQHQLAHVQTLSVSSEEVAYLASLRVLGIQIFRPAFLAWFARDFRLAPIRVWKEGEVLQVETSGLWLQTTLWETIVLSIINELYARDAVRRRGWSWEHALSLANRALSEKIALLRDEALYASITEFGTRRRAGREWQAQVVLRLARELPQGMFLGTSNVHLAMELGLVPIGTMAHELFSVAYALARIAFGKDAQAIAQGQTEVFEKWEALYAPALLIALPDTFGSETFFRGIAPKRFAQVWQGVRHDSGDPDLFAERVIRFYEEQGVDPRTKTLVFSDGLTVYEIVRLWNKFRGRIGLAFGWGTTLTFDIPDIRALSIVMKAIEANGQSAPKLSDNKAKYMGADEEVGIARELFACDTAYDVAPLV